MAEWARWAAAVPTALVAAKVTPVSRTNAALAIETSLRDTLPFVSKASNHARSSCEIPRSSQGSRSSETSMKPVLKAFALLVALLVAAGGIGACYIMKGGRDGQLASRALHSPSAEADPGGTRGDGGAQSEKSGRMATTAGGKGIPAGEWRESLTETYGSNATQALRRRRT